MYDLPDYLADRVWRRERAVPIADALDSLLDRFQESPDHESEIESEPVRLPISTGRLAIDRVLGGGLRRRQVTLFEAELPAQRDAILWSIARNSPDRLLLEVDSPVGATVWMWAGLAGVPAVAMSSGCMSEAEWRAASDVVGELSSRDLHVCSVASVRALAALVDQHDPDVLLLQNTERFGDRDDIVHELTCVARGADIAVVAGTRDQPGFPPARRDDVQRVLVEASDLGARATLVRVDSWDLLSVAEVEVDLLTGVVL